MKNNSLLAAVGVAIIIFEQAFWVLAMIMEMWKNNWYNTVNLLLNIIGLIGWILIGQFFYTLYKKQK